MQLFTQLKNQTISSFGQSHPFLSEILELQSIYHMSNYAFVLAITANK